MKRNILKVLALVLTLSVLLSGCLLLELGQLQEIFDTPKVTPFAEMEYQRPDIDALERQMQVCCDATESEKKVDKVLEPIWDFFEAYNSFYTNYNLSSIYYFKDTTDTYWENEYNYCMERSSRADAALDELYYFLADSPMREELEATDTFGEGFFDEYEGESIWDETFTAMMNEQARIEGDYHALCAASQEILFTDAYYEQNAPKLEALFVEMVALRQEIAAYAGYEDYQTFAYDFYHSRDYTPEQAEQYLEQIKQELVSLYRQANYLPIREEGMKECSEQQVYSYVQKAAQAMGGTVKDAFEEMTSAGLYDITYSEKKYDVSFEIYLPDYYAPYVFVSPMGTVRDQLSFAHEFGHYCNDYATYGMKPGIDVAEVFSQGLEYLSLCYTEDAQTLEQLKMLDSLNVFVEQAAYALFEHQVYDLKGDQLTVENVRALYEQTCLEFGFDIWVWDSRDYVLITHYFMAPMYVISYVVSNDVALQIYQLEKQEAGAGLALYERSLVTEQQTLLAFVDEVKLQSPFEVKRIREIRKTMEEILK